MPGPRLPDAPLERALERRERPEFAAALAALGHEANRALASPLTPPDRTAGYYHDYFCPDHATELRFTAAGNCSTCSGRSSGWG